MKTIVSRITAKELIEQGFVNNIHAWIGSGYLFCAYCNTYRMHYVLSKDQDHRTVCTQCHTSEYRRYESDRTEK